MALRKKVNLPNGISYNYHRISRLRLNVDEDEAGNIQNTLHLEVLSYVSEQIRASGAVNYVADQDYAFRISDADSQSNLRTVGYTLLKMLPEYEGAVDC